jgi:D-2-hydroxyacid dehydrogenase (NADP+)
MAREDTQTVKVVIAGRANEQDVEQLRRENPGLELIAAGRDELAGALADADGVYCLGLTSEQFRAAKKLRWVQSQGAGVEWLGRCPEIVGTDVAVTNTRGAHAQTIAEHAFGMLLCLTRGLEEQRANQKAHQWGKPSRQLVGLSGMTLGTIGLGRIGTAIAQRAHGFDMTVVALDANDVPRPDYVSQFWKLDGLNDFLAACDVVAVAIPITAETRGLIGQAQIARMKTGSYLLVMSRGGIVDESAVAAALTEGKLAGAGMDVFENEPLEAESPLWDAPNSILTPHCSGASRQTTALAWSIFAENLGHFVRGEPLSNLVDKKRGY